MIYLIGGPPRGGKTTLAESLSKEKSIPYFPIDHITSVISPYIPEEEYSNKLPLRIARQKTNYNNDIFYAKYSIRQITGFYLQQAETFWPGVESFIKYALEDEHDLILEGWQMLPHFMNKIISPENKDKLKIIFLYKIDRNDILSGMKASTVKNDWVTKNTKEESTFLAIADMVSYFGDYIEKEAKKYNLTAINMDFDFKQKLSEVLWSL